MTKIIIGKAGSGKTTELIKLSAETGAYIVAKNRQAISFIKEKAKKLDYAIPFPLTYQEFIESRFYGIGCRAFLIDDSLDLLRILCKGINLEAITINESSNENQFIFLEGDSNEN